jgi:hypothetical protein
MATYSDPMLGYADYYSAGRYFALAGAASALTGASLVYVSAGHIQTLVHTSAELALTAMAGWILLGFGLLMTIVVLGSLLITKRAKQTITVSQVGVLSKAPRKELFLARDEMLGMAEIPGRPTPRGTLLVTADSGRQLLIPQWIGGYATCLEEIRNLGVPTMPPYRPTRTQTIAGWLSWFVVFFRSGVGRVGRLAPGRPNSSMDGS